jgi:hypothetical protein
MYYNGMENFASEWMTHANGIPTVPPDSFDGVDLSLPVEEMEHRGAYEVVGYGLLVGVWDAKVKKFIGITETSLHSVHGQYLKYEQHAATTTNWYLSCRPLTLLEYCPCDSLEMDSMYCSQCGDTVIVDESITGVGYKEKYRHQHDNSECCVWPSRLPNGELLDYLLPLTIRLEDLHAARVDARH